MIINDIEKEGFMKLEEDKSKDISKDDYNQVIEYAYISQLKYKNGKVNNIKNIVFDLSKLPNYNKN